MSSEVVDVLTGEVLSGDLIHELDELEARSLTDRIVHSTTLAAQLVADAWQGRAWKALGYKSWESYADAELPMLGSNSSNRHVLLVGLRKVGMSTRAIAAATGLHHSTVARGVANATPETTTGTDGKQYPSKIRRTETIEFTGEATDREAVGVESEDVPSSPTFDPGEAALGDDAEEPAPPYTSPGPATSDDGRSPRGADLSDPHAKTVTLAARHLARACEFFSMFSPEVIHDLNDPEVTETVEWLIAVARKWGTEFESTQPTGLTVIEGGRQ